MSLKELFGSIRGPMEVISRWVTYIGSCVTIGSVILDVLEWGKSGPFRFLKDNIQVVWLITVSAAAFTLWIWTSRLHRRFVSGFSDNFTGDLHTNWDFVGPWRIPEKNTLLVTGSDAGGITKIGAQWENYTFEFRARITDRCLGVIVRAQDMNNYYMLQISTDKIHPHRRVAVPVIDTSPPALHEALKKENVVINPIKFQIGWEIFDPPIPLYHQLNDWFDTKIVVRGESVRLYINNELVFKQESFLKIPTGKVGFRNDGTETALVRNVKVKLQT